MCSRAPGLARDDARQQREVVVDDGRVDLAPGDVDELQAGLAEQQEQEEQPFLVRLHDRARVARRRSDRRHDDERLAGVVEPHRAPDGHEALLQPGEALAALLLAEVAQPRLGLDELGSCPRPRGVEPGDVVGARRP